MAVRWFRRQDRVALAMIDALEAGTIRTPGAWMHLIRHLERLPPRLRSWTIERIRSIAGDTTADYLLSRLDELQSQKPAPVYARCR
jgi:hypothetical protein